MMKKRTALTLLTGALMVSATAGTYAQWDKVTAKNTSESITLRKPVTVTASTNSVDAVSTDLTTMPYATGTVAFTIDDPSKKAGSMELKPVVNGSGVTNDDFKIEISDGVTPLPVNGAGVFTDSTLGSDSTSYTVTVTPLEKSEDKVSAAGELTIDVTAELKAAQPLQ